MKGFENHHRFTWSIGKINSTLLLIYFKLSIRFRESIRIGFCIGCLRKNAEYEDMVYKADFLFPLGPMKHVY